MQISLKTAIRRLIAKDSDEAANAYAGEMLAVMQSDKNAKKEWAETAGKSIRALKDAIKEANKQRKDASPEEREQINVQIADMNAKIETLRTQPLNHFLRLPLVTKQFATSVYLLERLAIADPSFVQKHPDIFTLGADTSETTTDYDVFRSSIPGDHFVTISDYVAKRVEDLENKFFGATTINDVVKGDFSQYLNGGGEPTIEQLVEIANRYHEEEGKRTEALLDLETKIKNSNTGVELLKDYGNGLGMYRLLPNPNENGRHTSLVYEGDIMGHCVGGYSFDKGNEYFSLRSSDKDGLLTPHCTISIENGHLRQIKGRANKNVKFPYIPAVRDFVESLNMKIPQSERANIGYVQGRGVDEKQAEFDLYNLPEEGVTFDTLSLYSGDYKYIDFSRIGINRTLIPKDRFLKSDVNALAKMKQISNLEFEKESFKGLDADVFRQMLNIADNYTIPIKTFLAITKPGDGTKPLDEKVLNILEEKQTELIEPTLDLDVLKKVAKLPDIFQKSKIASVEYQFKFEPLRLNTSGDFHVLFDTAVDNPEIEKILIKNSVKLNESLTLLHSERKNDFLNFFGCVHLMKYPFIRKLDAPFKTISQILLKGLNDDMYYGPLDSFLVRKYEDTTTENLMSIPNFSETLAAVIIKVIDQSQESLKKSNAYNTPEEYEANRRYNLRGFICKPGTALLGNRIDVLYDKLANEIQNFNQNDFANMMHHAMVPQMAEFIRRNADAIEKKMAENDVKLPYLSEENIKSLPLGLRKILLTPETREFDKEQIKSQEDSEQENTEKYIENLGLEQLLNRLSKSLPKATESKIVKQIMDSIHPAHTSVSNMAKILNSNSEMLDQALQNRNFKDVISWLEFGKAGTESAIDLFGQLNKRATSKFGTMLAYHYAYKIMENENVTFNRFTNDYIKPAIRKYYIDAISHIASKDNFDKSYVLIPEINHRMGLNGSDLEEFQAQFIETLAFRTEAAAIYAAKRLSPYKYAIHRYYDKLPKSLRSNPDIIELAIGPRGSLRQKEVPKSGLKSFIAAMPADIRKKYAVKLATIGLGKTIETKKENLKQSADKIKAKIKAKIKPPARTKTQER